jgi:hypothetical protein
MGPEDSYCMLHCNENPIYVFLFWDSPNFHIRVSVSNLYIPRIGPHTVFPCSRIGRLTWKYINLSQIYECRIWETEHYNSVSEIRRLHTQCTVSFLGIHKWEPDIYIGFTPALHLQCSFDTCCGPARILGNGATIV